MAAILGFNPLLDLRLSIANKSGRAAKVVPNPATKPMTSDLRKLGSNRLWGSSMANSPQPARMITLKKEKHNRSLLRENMFTWLIFHLCHSGCFAEFEAVDLLVQTRTYLKIASGAW